MNINSDINNNNVLSSFIDVSKQAYVAYAKSIKFGREVQGKVRLTAKKLKLYTYICALGIYNCFAHCKMLGMLQQKT